MGRPDGFKKWHRALPSARPASERIGDFKEFIEPFSPEQARKQGGRCMDCGVPFCVQGCPLGNRIPDWNDLVYRDQFEAAWRALDSTNNFPEFTGRLCPAPCEAACVLNINQDAVTIELIEKEIAERAFAEGWVRPRPPRVRTGRSVAIVGSGPAGLAAAAQLNHAGHHVTVFERQPKVGGLLRYGIPDFKMEKHIIDRRLAILQAEGVVFETSVSIGKDRTWSSLVESFDAVVVAIGAERPRDLDVPGRDLDGICFAMDYLRAQNRRVSGEASRPREASESERSAEGLNVVILGGGDTGSDCLGTALRQGATQVTQLELLPAPPPERSDQDLWPAWPAIFRTSSSQREGGERLFALQTTRLHGEGGRIRALEAQRIAVEPSQGGRPQLVAVDEEPVVLPCDLLILAMGFTQPVAESLERELGVERTPRGAIAVGPDFRTSVPGVYAAGDAQRGASLIVWAISDGREAARQVDADLRGGRSVLPTRGRDQGWRG
ncbi:MAG: glutamate synthase subunit beta [Deltaproteobacteria bacterium]|nr:MAG: glutamate synthase subunit beta [Deltaproteobacteria bacterium]